LNFFVFLKKVLSSHFLQQISQSSFYLALRLRCQKLQNLLADEGLLVFDAESPLAANGDDLSD
jgi:hypothetical protein